MGGFAYTAWDDRILRQMYVDQSVKDIAFILNRSEMAVYARAQKIGAKRSAEYAAKIRQEANIALTEAGKNTRLQAGAISWNKGKKQSEYMSPENIAKTAATRFKKGQDPHNTVPIGSVRLSKDGHYEIKVQHSKGKNSNNSNFSHVHRVLYEKLHGPIARGLVIVFLDGNTKNFAHDNLKALTKAENLYRNQISDSAIVKKKIGIKNTDLAKKFAIDNPEMIEVLRNIIKIKKTLNEHLRKN